MAREIVVETPPGRLAFQEVVGRYAAYAWNVARGVLRSADLAEDACQDAFLALWRREAPFATEASLRVWLGRVTHNAALKVLRSRRRRRAREIASDVERPGLGEATDMATADSERALRALVDDLPDEERLVVRLKYFQKIPQHEIAGILDCSTGTVSNRLHRALERLRRDVARAGVAGAVGHLEQGLGACAPEAVPSTLLARLAQVGGAAAATTPTGVSLAVKLLAPVLLVAAAAVVLVPTLVGSRPSASDASDAHGALANERPAPGSEHEDGARLQGRAPEPSDADAPPQAPGAAPASPASARPAGTLTLRGVVLAPDGRPVAGARVRLGSPPKAIRVEEHETRTDADGVWTFEDLPAGTWWQVSVRAEGTAPLTQVLGRVDAPPAQPIELRLHASWSIRGVLTDPYGEPAGGPVTLITRTKGYAGRSQLDVGANGSFAIPDLDPRKFPPEETVLEFRHPRFRPLVVDGWADRIGADGWAVVDLCLEPGAAVAGTVCGPDAAPRAGVDLVLLPEDVSPQDFSWDRRETKTDAKGGYAFEGLPAGRYVLRGRGGGLVLEHPPHLEIPGEGRIDRDLALGKGRTILGRVVDARGNPLRAVRVGGADELHAFTMGAELPVDAEGRFRIEALSFERRRFQLTLTDVPSFDPADLETTVLASSTREVEIVVRSKSAGLAGDTAEPDEVEEPAPSGPQRQGPSQVLLSSATVEVVFPEGE